MIIFGTLFMIFGGILLVGSLILIGSDDVDLGVPGSVIGLGLALFGFFGIMVGVDNEEELERNSLINQLNTVEVTSYVDVDRLMKNKVYVAKGDVIYVWEDGKLLVK